MIAQLRGTLLDKQPLEIVLDCGGVGYAVSVSTQTAEHLPGVGEQASIFTMLIVREDAMNLYGFKTLAERDVFKLLISISGIGPKIAIGILSAVGLGEFRDLIIRQDLLRLQKFPGIGKKTAERLLVELRDKIVKVEPGDDMPELPGTVTSHLVRDETLAAMITLGYPRALADKAIRQALAAEPTTLFSSEQLLRKSLRFISR